LLALTRSDSTIESVGKLTRDDVVGFYRGYVRPDTAIIAVVGDVTVDEARREVLARFGGWARPAAPPPPTPAEAGSTTPRTEVITKELSQATIMLGRPAIRQIDPDYFPLSVMNAIFGGVFNSRINLNLRERHGYTYGARSQFAFRRQAGPFVIAAPVRNEVTRESVQEVLAELRRIRTGDIEDHELDDTKSYLMGVFPATVQTASDIAGRLVDMELYGLPEDYFDRYRENIAAVTKEEIERVAVKYLDPDRVLIVIVGNAEEIREPLGTLGLPMHELDLEGNQLAVG